MRWMVSDRMSCGSLSRRVVQPLPEADLALVKSAPSASVTGGQVTYTLLVTNNGPDDVSGVTVSDALRAGETLVSANRARAAARHDVSARDDPRWRLVAPPQGLT
jgi:uncharacterized repeat protein (TIGR01451 family)